MALIQLNRTKTGSKPTTLADGELYIDQLNGMVWWADSTGRLRTGALGGMPSGTRMMFQQSAAPVGWTKSTTHDNKGIRIVSGNVGVGGTLSFSDVFHDRITGDTVLTEDQLPAHNHSLTDPGHTHDPDGAKNSYQTPGFLQSAMGDAWSGLVGGNGGPIMFTAKTKSAKTGITVQTVGSNQPHNHPMSMDLQYVDVILAEKT